MFAEQMLSFVQDSGLAHFLDAGRYITMAVQTFHILGFTLLLAIVVATTLRVEGWALGALPLPQVAASLRSVYRIALGVALGAGVLLFLPRALSYGLKDIFAWKMVLMAFTIIVQGLLHRGLLNLEEGVDATPVLKALALATPVLWFTTAAAGRAVGFV